MKKNVKIIAGILVGCSIAISGIFYASNLNNSNKQNLKEKYEKEANTDEEENIIDSLSNKITGMMNKKSDNSKMPTDDMVMTYDEDMSFSAQPNYQQTEFNTEEYQTIQENAIKSPIHDPLSTFSIDVDTAAYSNMRRFINQGRLPVKDSVRIEEFINYFNYNYQEASEEKPFSINAEFSDCPWNDKRQLMMIGIKGRDLKESKKPANNLVFLLDVSGSMNSSNKLPLLKKSFSLLVNQLTEKDRVSIVTYAGKSEVVLDSAKGNEKEKILSSLTNLSAGGGTAGAQGIKTAYSLADKNHIEDGNNRIILATDGDFNIGVSSTSELESMVSEKKENGTFITVLGFGTGNLKDSRMEIIADKGNGNYAYIDNLNEAKKALVHDVQGTLFTIAKDVKIQVEFNPSKVKGYRLIGYENRLLNKEDFNDDKKDAGELGAGHTVTALYEIIPEDSDEEVPSIDNLKYQENQTKYSDEILTVKLRYKEPNESTSKLMTLELTDEDYKSSPNDNFNFAASVAQFGLILRESEYKGSASFDSVLELAKKSMGEDPFGYRGEFTELVEKAKNLKE